MKNFDIAAYIWPAYTGQDERAWRFWPEKTGEWQSVKTSVKSLGSLASESAGVSEELNSALAASREMPGARKFIAVPEMVWSAWRFTVATACSAPNAAPAIPAHRKEIHGLPVKWPIQAPVKAPIVIIPSIPILTTPLFSEKQEPRAAKRSGGV